MNTSCTIYRTANIIGKRWTLLILLELYKENPIRFHRLKKTLPEITSKMLSARLKELEKDGLVTKKTDSSQVPVSCEYSLTKSGQEFVEIIKYIKKWALKWKINNKTCLGLDCKNCRL